MSETQTVFNVVVLFAACCGGWVMKMIYDSITELKSTDTSLKNAIDEVKENYARREDVKDLVTDLKQVLVRIEHKIDRKVDK